MQFKSLLLAAIFMTGITGSGYAASATPSLIDGDSVSDILNLARGYGSATLGTQDSGAPKISGKIEGQPYSIYFSTCDEKTHQSCEDLDFYTGYSGIKPALDKINGWNRDTRFARAYLDSDGDAGMDMDVNLVHGVSGDNLDSTMSLWAQLVKKYTTFVTAK